MNLRTKYLGLDLRTPLVPSASPLTENLDHLKRMEDAGASAVVLHSLFEEQIRADRSEAGNGVARNPRDLGETSPDFSFRRNFAAGPDAYLEHLTKAKQSLEIPVIASLNGTTFGGWTTFSKQIAQAGADALELNFYSVPTDAECPAEDIELSYLTLLSTVKAQLKIPVAVKLSPFFTNLMHFARRLQRSGADGLVLFNRFYQPDIPLDDADTTPQMNLSTSSASRLPLRWIAILYGKIGLSRAATSGIHRGRDALKMLMAGADVTMLCSALLRHGIAHLRTVEEEMTAWMEEHEYESAEQLKGRLSQQNSPDPAAFERAQYIRAIGTFHTPPV